MPLPRTSSTASRVGPRRGNPGRHRRLRSPGQRRPRNRTAPQPLGPCTRRCRFLPSDGDPVPVRQGTAGEAAPGPSTLPAWAGPGAATLFMVLVLFIVSLLSFIIFVKLPAGDPTPRAAGQTSTPGQIENTRPAFAGRPYGSGTPGSRRGSSPGRACSCRKTCTTRTATSSPSRNKSPTGCPSRSRSASAPRASG